MGAHGPVESGGDRTQAESLILRRQSRAHRRRERMARWERKIEPDEVAPSLRRLLDGLDGITEKRMFGGLCFMWRGHMLCGVGKPGFLFRVDASCEPSRNGLPGGQPMVMGGRVSRGFYWVDPGKCDEPTLERWIHLAKTYVSTLPLR